MNIIDLYLFIAKIDKFKSNQYLHSNRFFKQKTTMNTKIPDIQKRIPKEPDFKKKESKDIDAWMIEEYFVLYQAS